MLGAASDVGVKRYFRPERRGLRNRMPSPIFSRNQAWPQGT
jgi:hypothetical protein